MVTLVTGAAGFIGSHLVGHLLDQGRKVFALDSMWTGSLGHLEKFQTNQNFSYKICDVRDLSTLQEEIEEIYHLACPASPDRFEESPVEILETCFRGTKNVLDLAVSCKARVLLASTSEIYGDPQVIPQREDYRGNVNSFGPRSCYDEGKRVAEALAFAYQSKYGLEVRIARIFNAYGPQMSKNDGRAIPNFIAAAIEGRSLIIHGDGNSTRCFQYVSDCVEGLVALMKSDYDRPVNIGSDSETRVEDIARMVAKVVAERTGQVSPVSITYGPARQDDPVRRKPDITLARKVLSWSPRVPLQEGIVKTMIWFLEMAQV